MIEVLISPSHLAGAAVTTAKKDGDGPTWLVLDRKHPTKPGYIAVNAEDVTTVPMLPDQLTTFRVYLGDAPEGDDVTYALVVAALMVEDPESLSRVALRRFVARETRKAAGEPLAGPRNRTPIRGISPYDVEIINHSTTNTLHLSGYPAEPHDVVLVKPGQPIRFFGDKPLSALTVGWGPTKAEPAPDIRQDRTLQVLARMYSAAMVSEDPAVAHFLDITRRDYPDVLARLLEFGRAHREAAGVDYPAGTVIGRGSADTIEITDAKAPGDIVLDPPGPHDHPSYGGVRLLHQPGSRPAEDPPRPHLWPGKLRQEARVAEETLATYVSRTGNTITIAPTEGADALVTEKIPAKREERSTFYGFRASVGEGGILLENISGGDLTFHVACIGEAPPDLSIPGIVETMAGTPEPGECLGGVEAAPNAKPLDPPDYREAWSAIPSHEFPIRVTVESPGSLAEWLPFRFEGQASHLHINTPNEGGGDVWIRFTPVGEVGLRGGAFEAFEGSPKPVGASETVRLRPEDLERLREDIYTPPKAFDDCLLTFHRDRLDEMLDKAREEGAAEERKRREDTVAGHILDIADLVKPAAGETVRDAVKRVMEERDKASREVRVVLSTKEIEQAVETAFASLQPSIEAAIERARNEGREEGMAMTAGGHR